MKMDTRILLKMTSFWVDYRGLSKIADFVVPVPFCQLGSYWYSEIKVFDFFPL